MKKKLLIMILCLSLVLSACGGGTAPKEEKPAKKNEEKTVEKKEENKVEAPSEKELEKVSFVLDWTPNTNHTGIYVAKELGYYKDEGLDVEIIQPPEDGAEVMVGSGKAEFGVSFQDYMPPTLIGNTKMPIKAIATIIQHNTSGIMSRKGEGLDRPKGMEEKAYATWDLPIEQAIIKDVVEKDGGDFSKIEMIPTMVTDEVTALKTKMCDAIWVYYAWAGIAAKVNDLDIDYFGFKDINDALDFYSPVLISNEKFMEENPGTVKKFLKATKMGYEYAIENPEEAAKILLKADSALDENLVIESQKYLADEYKAEVERWGYIDPERWNKFYDWLFENGLVEEEIPDGAGFTNDYLPE